MSRDKYYSNRQVTSAQGVAASSCETKREREIVDADFSPFNLIYAPMEGVRKR